MDDETLDAKFKEVYDEYWDTADSEDHEWYDTATGEVAAFGAALEALRELDTAERPFSISFSGEASDGIPDRINAMQGWYVRLTPQEGEPFDAHVLGWAKQSGWSDAVLWIPVDESSGMPVDEHAEPQTTRVYDIYVY